jgi:hypothetical protein
MALGGPAPGRRRDSGLGQHELTMTDDLSISGSLEVYRRIEPRYFRLDTNGQPLVSDGAFRTAEMSIFRCDRATQDEVLAGHLDNGLATITVQQIRDAGCIVVADEPPVGHLVVYRSDNPGQRFSGGMAAAMNRASKLNRWPATP